MKMRFVEAMIAVMVTGALSAGLDCGEIRPQAERLTRAEPEQTSVIWEPIEAGDRAAGDIREEPTDEEDGVQQRTHEAVTHWWEIPGEYKNDPDIPDDIEEAALTYGEMFGICPELLEAICNRETGGTYRVDLIDDTGSCYGPMQINIRAQRERIAAYGLTADDMLTADGAMIVAASYLAELFEEYEDPAVVLMKYNGASTALRAYRETGELNGYTSYILQLSEELERKHGK